MTANIKYTNEVLNILKSNPNLAKNIPQELYTEGDYNLLVNNSLKISVVGSRNATPVGIENTIKISAFLILKGVTIVSGLAKGIDTIAHNTALDKGGKTIAVLGTPINECYPKENLQLLNRIKKEGLAISQFTTTHKSNFPNRNKTMALFSDATIIVEGTEISGTQHQGWESLRLGRKLFIMQNIINNKIPWAIKMVDSYGADVIAIDSLEDILKNLDVLTEWDSKSQKLTF
ncbi:MAG: DNA-processing protein DprA [Limnohabitans sp.]|nr:DNA-processing protein DprA [Limnohabitans sp.]